MAIVPTLRRVKGAKLTWDEGDDNFQNLYDAITQNETDIATIEAYSDIQFVGNADTVLTRKKVQVVGVNVDTVSVLLSLPASPIVGDTVFIFCNGGSFSVNAMIVGRNGNTIMGLSEDMTVSSDNAHPVAVWNGATWRVF